MEAVTTIVHFEVRAEYVDRFLPSGRTISRTK